MRPEPLQLPQRTPPMRESPGFRYRGRAGAICMGWYGICWYGICCCWGYIGEDWYPPPYDVGDIVTLCWRAKRRQQDLQDLPFLVLYPVLLHLGQWKPRGYTQGMLDTGAVLLEGTVGRGGRGGGGLLLEGRPGGGGLLGRWEEWELGRWEDWELEPACASCLITSS